MFEPRNYLASAHCFLVCHHFLIVGHFFLQLVPAKLSLIDHCDFLNHPDSFIILVLHHQKPRGLFREDICVVGQYRERNHSHNKYRTPVYDEDC